MSNTTFFSPTKHEHLHVTNEIYYVRRKIQAVFTKNLEHRISRTAHLHEWMLKLIEVRAILEERLEFEAQITERLLKAI